MSKSLQILNNIIICSGIETILIRGAILVAKDRAPLLGGAEQDIGRFFDMVGLISPPALEADKSIIAQWATDCGVVGNHDVLNAPLDRAKPVRSSRYHVTGRLIAEGQRASTVTRLRPR